MRWERQQRRILRHARRGRNIVVDADAGSGKSTIAMAMAQERGDRSLMISFNQDMKVENIKKARALKIYGDRALDVRTFHGWGISVFPRKVKIEPFKVERYVRELRSGADMGGKLVYALKQFRGRGFLHTDRARVLEEIGAQRVVYFSDAARDYWQAHVDSLCKSLQALDSSESAIDFDDMCRRPVQRGWITGAGADWGAIYSDEIQDLNPDQSEMVRLAAQGTRVQLVGTGDSKQAIYGFRGSAGSIERMREIIGGVSLPLNTTYRCRSEIVDFVNEFVPDSNMRAHEQGGEVERVVIEEGTRDRLGVAGMIEARVDMIIACRNSTLISVWIYLFQQGIDATLKGSGVVGGLKSMVGSVQSYGWSEFQRAIRDIAQADRRNRFPDQHSDMARALIELIAGLRIRNRHELLDALDRMRLADHGIQLETVHSSKGREADRVAVISDWFESRDDPVENRKYVAWSRARHYLMVVRPAPEERR